MDLNFARDLLKKTKEDYDSIAQDFSRTRQSFWKELEMLKDYVKEGEKVLDIGCGNGRLFQILKDKNIEYTGIDFSKNLIELAKKKYPEGNFLVANALNLPFKENTFDKVFLIAVLHHIPSKELRSQVLKEAKRVLKPQGLLILTVWNLWRKRMIFLLLKYSLLKIVGKSKLDFGDIFIPWGKKIKRYYHFFTKGELINLVEREGLKIEKFGVSKNETGKRSNFYLIALKTL